MEFFCIPKIIHEKLDDDIFLHSMRILNYNPSMKKEILEVFHERKVRHDELNAFNLEENIIVLYHDADPLVDVK